MRVYGIDIPEDKGLTNFDLIKYARLLQIKDFRGVFMRDNLPLHINEKECGIVNLNKSNEQGSHWVCYYKNGSQRIYFDSFGQVSPIELQKYLKTKHEFLHNVNVIQRNTDIVQHLNTYVCGHLCLFVLTSLTCEHLRYQDVLNLLNDGYSHNNW